MKTILKNYTFSTSAKTITLTDITTVRLDKLALITDVTTNKILYNFADTSVATATVATNVITLSVLQGGENDTDKLRIDYDVESSDTSAFADATTPVSATSLPLPSGAATGAKQDTGNTSLSSIDTKTPALGQALAAASVPVVLTAAQISTLTPPSNTGFALDSSLTTIDTDLKSNIVLKAGTNIIGKVTTDQTTHGTTDLVAADITKIGGTTLTLGQQTAANSMPVILPSATITTLTPPSNTGYALDSSLTTIDTDLKSNITLHAGSNTIGNVEVTDGTNIANTLKSDGTAAGQNSIMIAPTGYTTSTLTLNAGAANTSWYDLLNYPWISLEVLTNSTPITINFQTSGDASQTNARPTQLVDSAFTLNHIPESSTTSATATYFGPRTGRYFRLSSSASGGQTATVVLTFYTSCPPSLIASVNPSSSGVGAASPQSVFNIGGKDGSGNSQIATLNSSTYTSKYGLDTNLLGSLGTAFTTAGMINVGGMVATNVAITDNPLNIGAQAVTSENSAITTARKAQLVADKVGKLITLPYANPENFVSGIATATGTADTQVIAAQGAGIFIYITSISIANTGSTSSLVTIETDTASAKTAIWYMINPAGGGDNITFTTPLKVPVANKNLGFVCGSSSTTQYVSISGYFGI